MKYEKDDLVNLFTQKNECDDSEIVNFTETTKKKILTINLRPALRSSSVISSNRPKDYILYDFGTQTGFTFGIEAELRLNFNKNKWAVILEPTYRSYKSEKKSAQAQAILDYSSIEFPVGIRHYMFLSKNSKLFINASINLFDFKLNSSIDYGNLIDDYLPSSSNFAFGVGYKLYHKFSLEFRYYTKKNIVDEYDLGLEYNASSIILGYSIF